MIVVSAPSERHFDFTAQPLRKALEAVFRECGLE
jgi:hypothetical protein